MRCRRPRRLGRVLVPLGLTALAALTVAAACVGSPGETATPLGSEHGIASVVADPDLEVTIDAIVLEAIEDGPLAGVAVAVGRAGEVVLAKGYGLADIENDVPVSAETVFRIGSITKQYTAAAILQLAEQGEISLHDDLTRFLPEYPTQGHVVPISHLLNHTSGIKSYTNLGKEWVKTIPLDLDPDELLEMFQDVPFEFEPGDEWNYNNSGYYLLGLVVEEVSGKPYKEYLQQHVYEPAGVTTTYYCDNSPIIRFRAEGYGIDDGEFVNDDLIGMRQPYSAGSLCTNVVDLVDWTYALAGGQVVSDESYRAMTTPLPLNDGTAQDYGFGLAIGDLDGHKKISHGGGINGFLSMLAHYLDDEVVVAVLTNSENGNPGAIEQRIARAALGLPEPEILDLEIAEEDMAPYVGEYELEETRFRLYVEDAALMMQARREPTRMKFQGQHTFVPAADCSMRFVFAVEDGRATSFVLHAPDGVFVAIRVLEE